ncbi:MAG: tRNA (adenosine(37)-N6)-threonylcarbamoyltransferase complex dimerization subunit type 1 TsaB [Oscillospiraceae bacterium]|nr:tRNA (adenosine(37)-N6)-threonylcarbamoyltransferase complex dimerization subunit type 1 TsaB [Oscillospiraceae bacterium]
MKILSIDCTAAPASCAIIDGEKLIAEFFVNIKLTHSQTLMPMIKGMLESSNTLLSDIDGFAIASGPGSFTGVRIGISAVKGLAFADNKPCVGVSTLEAMACNLRFNDCVICAVMDARCNQLYNANFVAKSGRLLRLCADRALTIEDLIDDIAKVSESDEYKNLTVMVVGDGTDIFIEKLKLRVGAAVAAPNQLRFQRASGVGFASIPMFLSNQTVLPEQLLPVYLRLPQAERELKSKSTK